MWGYSSGFLALLHEDELEYKVYAVDQLLDVVDLEWAQIAEKLDDIILLARDPSFASQKKAALLVAKEYYRLGKFEQAVEFAILSQELFNSSETDDFSMVIKSQLINMCRVASLKGETVSGAALAILARVLEDMLQKGDIAACYCLALESRQESYLKKCLEALPELVPYAIRVAVTNIIDPVYRLEILKMLVTYVQDQCTQTQIAKLFHSINDPESVTALLISLAMSENPDHILLAYQISFDLAENAGQKFRAQIISILNDDLPVIKHILTRQTPLQLQLNFQYKKINEDISLLNAFREGLDTEYMPIHSAVVLLFSYMYANTADDTYYRNNMQWFSTATKWHQFLTIAAVGVVHIGHLDAALTVLGTYLNSKAASEVTGGALYALGLIYANFAWDPKVLQIVRSSLTNSKQMYIQYGAALALGLINIGSQNSDDCEALKQIVMAEPVVPETGEAAGYGIGMVMLGCGKCEAVSELINFSEQCDHDRVNRGLAVGFGMMMYGHEHDADEQINRLLSERQPVLREGAAWTLAFAYVGTGNNDAIQKLLHIAVSDTSNDVRRIAVIGVGFVMSRNPEKIPEMLGLLSRSYHPYVRSGAALAIGIACAGTGNQEAIELIKPLLKDTDAIALQSSTIAMAMLLQQQSDASLPYCKEFRQYLRKKISKKSAEMTSFAISTAYGILNATGRNSIISCNTLRGENSIVSTVGIALFCNYFYFIPLSLMLPLAFHTTAIIGLDESLSTVEWPLLSRAKPSLFTNPPSFESEKEEKKLADAVSLSISKAKTKEELDAEKAAAEELAHKKIEELALEPTEEIIINPSRVTIPQLQFIDSTISADYEPVTEVSLGFVMLKRKGPAQGEAPAPTEAEEEKKE